MQIKEWATQHVWWMYVLSLLGCFVWWFNAGGKPPLAGVALVFFLLTLFIPPVFYSAACVSIANTRFDNLVKQITSDNEQQMCDRANIENETRNNVRMFSLTMIAVFNGALLAFMTAVGSEEMFSALKGLRFWYFG